LPTPVGFGFASVLGPTHGRVANVGYSPLLLVLWGHIPHNPLPWGLRPPGPPICPPPWALGLPAFWVPPVGGLLVPSFGFVGAHPPNPLPWGLRPPGPPICPPSWALGLPAFWVPLVAGLLRWANCPLVLFWGHIPQAPWEGAQPPPPPVQCRGVATLRPYLAKADFFQRG
jgi:hypothetical protein